MDTLRNFSSRAGARSLRFAALLAALLTTVPLASRAIDLAKYPVYQENAEKRGRGAKGDTPKGRKLASELWWREAIATSRATR